jgi:hypothetical protein
MKMTWKRRHLLAPLLIALVAASLALMLGVSQARADSGSSMNMTPEQMQNMTAPAPAASATAMSGAGGQGSGAVMDPNMDMGAGGGSANWFVVGGFVALIAGATLAAVLTKRHLRRRMLAGELAGAGIQDV